jgi:NTP pyrophosphatase (non-canonical NTP hydrolase)
MTQEQRKMTYREFVMSRAKEVPEKAELLFGAVGLAGEAGEVLELGKKEYFHGKEPDRQDVLLELGDVRFYLEYLCCVYGFTLAQIEEANVTKLLARHPNGYNAKHYTGIEEG